MAREHYLEAVLSLSPLNRTAASVVSQKGCTPDKALSREELIEIVNRLMRKQRLLKRVLGIETKAQHKNLAYKFNVGRKADRFKKDPRSVVEYLRLGRQAEFLKKELEELNNAARAKRRAGWLAKQGEQANG